MSNKKVIKAVICKPYEEAREIEVENDYKSLSNIIGGEVAVLDLIMFKVVIVYDDEGKLKSTPLNRAIYQVDELTDFKTKKKHQLIDIIANTFIVCGTDGENLISLSDKQIEQYINLFRFPEVFRLKEDGVEVIRIKDSEVVYSPWEDTK